MSPPGLAVGAVDEARTRDPQLGKLMLYQLSYYRIFYRKGRHFEAKCQRKRYGICRCDGKLRNSQKICILG